MRSYSGFVVEGGDRRVYVHIGGIYKGLLAPPGACDGPGEGGFCWGELCPETVNLALALIRDAYPEVEPTEMMCMAACMTLLARLPRRTWTLTADQVRDWIDKYCFELEEARQDDEDGGEQ